MDAVPDRPAVVAGDAHRSFLELDERANRVGEPLVLALGLDPGGEGGGLRLESGRMARGHARRVQGPARADQRQLPLRRRRARLPLRQCRPATPWCWSAPSRPRVAARARGGPDLRHLVVLDDGSGVDATAAGRRPRTSSPSSPPPARRALGRPTISTSSTPAAPPASPRAPSGATRTSSSALGGNRLGADPGAREVIQPVAPARVTSWGRPSCTAAPSGRRSSRSSAGARSCCTQPALRRAAYGRPSTTSGQLHDAWWATP